MKKTIRLLCALFMTVFACGYVSAAEKPEIFVQLGHQKNVGTASFSLDGKYLATGSEDQTVKLWDVASGSEIRTFTGHAAKISAVAISSGGGLAVSGDEKGVIKLWNALTGQEIKSIQGHATEIKFLSIAPDSLMFTSVATDQTMKSWNAATGRLIKTTADIAGLPFMASGNKYVAVRNPAGNNFSLLDISSASEAGTFKASRIFFTSASFSWDGKYALLMGDDYDLQKTSLEFIDITASKKIAFWHTDKNAYYAALSPDGRQALSAGSGGLKLWDTSSGRELKTLTTDLTFFAAFSPDGQFIISAGLYAPTLWEVSTGSVARSFMRRPLSSVYSATLSPDGRQAITTSSNASPLLWDITSGKTIKIFKGYSNARFNADGNHIVLTSQDKTLELLDAATQKTLRKLPGAYAAFSRDGRYVAELISGGHLKVWETATRKEALNHTESSGKIKGFGLAANNRYLLAILDKAAKRIDIATGAEEKFSWVEPHYFGSSISPDGRFIAVFVANKDFKHTLKIYDVEAKQEIRSHEGVVPAASVIFSPNGRQILFSTQNNLVLCDASTGAVLNVFTGHTNVIWSMAFSSGGERIISASVDGSIKLWGSATGKEIINLAGHQSAVQKALISPNGKQVISVGNDNTTRLWDIATGKEQARLLSFTDGEWIAMTPEGYYTGSEKADQYVNVRIGNKVYGVDQYREKFYRPEVVMAALAGKPITGLASLTSVKPAPSVSIVDTPASVGSDEATVKVKVADAGGGIGDVRLYLNGSAVVLDRTRNLAVAAVQGKAQVFSYKVRLVSGKNSLRAIAFNAGNSMQSTDATHEIEAKIAAKKPSLHALVIGIQDYENPKLTLKYPVADAKLMAATLRERAPGLFEGVNVVELTTRAQTTKDAITKTLKEMSGKVRPDDLFVFFVASHGTVDDGEYFLITSNVGATSTHLLKQTALSQDDLKALIANVPATKKLVLIDTCNAGKLGEAIQVAMLTRGMNEDTALKILSRAVGSTILSASNSVQEALEGYKDHGLFTWVVAEGLKGAADSDRDGYVKTHELVNYVDSQVPDLAEQVFKHKQYPTTTLSGQGFPVVRVK